MLPLYLSPKRLVCDRNEAFRKSASEYIAKLQISKIAADSKVKRPLTHELHSSLYIGYYNTKSADVISTHCWVRRHLGSKRSRWDGRCDTCAREAWEAPPGIYRSGTGRPRPPQGWWLGSPVEEKEPCYPPRRPSLTSRFCRSSFPSAAVDILERGWNLKSALF